MRKPHRPVADSVDPAPRILRLVAACMLAGTGGERPKGSVEARLLRAADVLEGAPTVEPESGTQLGKLLRRERRVKERADDRTRTGRIIVTKVRARMSEEDERHYRAAVEAGEIEPERIV